MIIREEKKRLMLLSSDAPESTSDPPAPGQPRVPALPDLGRVPAQLHVWSPCALIQPRLSHFQWRPFVPDGFSDRFDVHLDLEDFLQRLV